VLCYHRIGEGGVPIYSNLPTKDFERQMAYLRKHCRVISMTQLACELSSGEGQGGVAVTFDDGYAGTYTEAFPILKRYSIPAMVYTTVDAIENSFAAWYDRIFLALQLFPAGTRTFELDTPRTFTLGSTQSRLDAGFAVNRYLRTVPDAKRRLICDQIESEVYLPIESLNHCMLSWNQAREMMRSGIEFGSHTLSHRVTSRLPMPELEHELARSKAIMEDRLQTPVRHFAYPFGQPDDCGTAATPVLRKLGYETAGTTVWGVNTMADQAMELRRVQIGEERHFPMFALRLAQLQWQKSNDDGFTLKAKANAASAMSQEVKEHQNA
jgi:peptidoglycan/xylan/chitin deacetylase (PgdA/CDA1 family)